MVESTYNVKKVIGDNVLIYNTYTKAFVKLDRNYWNDILNTIDLIDENHNLVKLGIIVNNTKTQFDCYRLGYLQKCFCNKVLTLVVAPTMNCNLGCKYCFEGSHKKPGVMTEKTEDKIVDFVKSQKPQALSITWFGGEPLLAFNRILSLAKKLKA